MKTLISLAALTLFASATVAQTPDRELARCAVLAEPAARLACLDPLVAAALARLQPAAQAAAQIKAQEQAFGGVRAEAAPGQIDSEIDGYVQDWGPNTRFRLKNGQVWRVADGSSSYVNLHNPKVRISRNGLGSYFLEFAGRNSSPKVLRVE